MNIADPLGTRRAADLTPSVARSEAVSLDVAQTVPATATAAGYLVGTSGEVPAALGVDRPTLAALGFEGQLGQVSLLPRGDGTILVAVGAGDPAKLDAAGLREVSAAFARGAAKHARIALVLAPLPNVPDAVAGQVVAEGALLARYRYDAFRQEPDPVLAALTLVSAAERVDVVARGVRRGRLFAAAQALTRDLANSPAAYLTAPRMAEIAEEVAARAGLGIEVFDRAALRALGCGGLLGVNAGSAEEPRMVKLTYRPKASAGGTSSAPHLALVGKGIMYDSGGVSLKPSDTAHSRMKNDMSGAAAILAAMSTLAALDCPTSVTGWLMCTDNMLQGSATKLGDVLTIRGGKTVEVMDTDAEGRLVMADALVLATEEGVDAIVDIATLTGACLRALGPKLAGVLGNDRGLIEQVQAAARLTDERVWELPLDRRYRSILDSTVADIKNWEEGHPGATTAALFLEEFVGDRPWTHLDIAGTAWSDKAESWHSQGCTGFGARLLIELALDFTPPSRAASAGR
ncbi:MAG TPA: leucyl aminopeptidase [Chloroflexota bacterium]|nr:leucyl aminopeptidase [Chloroflexota bacterium]